MAHWRGNFQFNPIAAWTIGTWVGLAALMLIARHGYI
jgi:hypothetical protein